VLLVVDPAVKLFEQAAAMTPAKITITIRSEESFFIVFFTFPLCSFM